MVTDGRRRRECVGEEGELTLENGRRSLLNVSGVKSGGEEGSDGDGGGEECSGGDCSGVEGSGGDRSDQPSDGRDDSGVEGSGGDGGGVEGSDGSAIRTLTTCVLFHSILKNCPLTANPGQQLKCSVKLPTSDSAKEAASNR